MRDRRDRLNLLQIPSPARRLEKGWFDSTCHELLHIANVTWSRGLMVRVSDSNAVADRVISF